MFLFLPGTKKEPKQLYQRMKILVVQFSSLTDVVLASPVVRILKSDLQHDVHFTTRQEFTSSLVANPYLDKIHSLERSFNQLIRELRQEKFDLVIDLQNSTRTKYLRFRVGGKSYSLNPLSFKKWLLVNFKIDLLPNLHLVERYLELIEPLGAKMDNLGLDYFIPEKDEVEHNWLPETHKNGYAVFAIEGAHSTNGLPINRMIELCDRINKPIILLGREQDMQIANQVEQFFQRGSDEEEKEIEELNKKSILFNACGKFSTNQAASIISEATWVFTHDSVMMHIAAAFKKPIFSIWGNTIPSFGKYPYRTQFTIFENKSLECRPCSETGYAKCPKGHFKCMNDLTFDFYLPD